MGEFMNEEYFDILDEFGNKTGLIKSRTLVHKDGNWHRAEHIWIVNQKGEILLQRRCATKVSDPNMLDISCAGHLTSGDKPIEGALRELKEELNLEVNPNDLKFITTLKRSPKHNNDFVDNEFDDMYLLHIDKDIEDLNYQKEEISEILFVPYQKFKEMVSNKQSDLVIYPDEYKILFEILDKEIRKGD